MVRQVFQELADIFQSLVFKEAPTDQQDPPIIRLCHLLMSLQAPDPFRQLGSLSEIGGIHTRQSPGIFPVNRIVAPQESSLQKPSRLLLIPPNIALPSLADQVKAHQGKSAVLPLYFLQETSVLLRQDMNLLRFQEIVHTSQAVGQLLLLSQTGPPDLSPALLLPLSAGKESRQIPQTAQEGEGTSHHAIELIGVVPLRQFR